MQTKTTKVLKLLYVQVLIGLALGILVGFLFPDFGASLKVLGDLFVKVVKMMIAPIVFCTIVTGITSLTDNKKIGKTLGKSLGLFYVLTILSLLIGLAAVLLIKPGQGMHIDPTHLDPSVAANATEGRRRRAPSASSSCTSSRTRSSVPSPRGTCCRCCSWPSCAASASARSVGPGRRC